MACRSKNKSLCEVARAYEIAAQLQTLIQQNSTNGDPRSQLADELCEEILCSLTTSLSVLNSRNSQSIQTKLRSDEKAGLWMKFQSEPSSKRRRASQNNGSVKTILTSSSTYYDGHEWRKYGQKYIKSSHFQRCCYKCNSGIEKGCQATNHVQLRNSNEPPPFEVCYNQQHTCRNSFVTPKPLMDQGTIRMKQDCSFSSPPTTNKTSPEIMHDHNEAYFGPAYNVSPDMIMVEKSISEIMRDPNGELSTPACTVVPDQIMMEIAPNPIMDEMSESDIELLRKLLAPSPDFPMSCFTDDPLFDGGIGLDDQIFFS